MPTESGFSNQKKLGQSQFKTIQNLGGDKFGPPVASKALFEKVASAQILSVSEILGSDGRVDFLSAEITAHGAIVGDVLRVDTGTLLNFEFDILQVLDANHVKILALVPAASLVNAFASVMGWVTNKANPDGSQIVSVTITGAATEAKQDSQIALATTLNSVVAKEAKQDSQITLATALNAKDFATQTTLAALNAKDFATSAKQDSQLTAIGLLAKLTDTQPVSIASLPLPTGSATAANQATEIASLSSIDTKLTSQATATLQTANNVLVGAVTETAPASDTASSGLNGRLQRIAQRLTSLIALLPASLGQKTMANSLAVTLASDQSSLPVIPQALTGSFQEILNLTTSAQTFTAPANAKWCKIYADDTNAANVRVKIGAAATVSSGIQLQPGRAEDFSIAGNISVIAESGTNQKVNVHFGV